MNSIIFELKNVYFSYLGKFPALCGIDISIEQGKKIAVIGANGSGKSTLLHLLDGLIFPDSGSVKFCGSELTENAFNNEVFSMEFRKKVGLVFQNPDVQLFCPSAREDIIFGPLQLGMAMNEIEIRLEEIAGVLDLKKLLDRAPHQLSIGEKRKVALASTLIIDPDILILDEPTAGLDPLTTRHIMDLFLKLNDSGKTLVISTHDLHIAEEISDIVFVFNQEKKIVKYGSALEILNDSRLLHDNNLIHIHTHMHEGKIHTHRHAHQSYHVKT